MRRSGGGLGFILLIIVAMIVLYLGFTQLSALRGAGPAGGDVTQEEVEQEDAVQQAQDAVDALNDRQQEAEDIAEGL